MNYLCPQLQQENSSIAMDADWLAKKSANHRKARAGSHVTNALTNKKRIFDIQNESLESWFVYNKCSVCKALSNELCFSFERCHYMSL